MDSSATTEEFVADPFAADIFNVSRAAEDDAAAKSDAPETVRPAPVWNRVLRKISAPGVDWNRLLQNLPFDFSEDLTRHITASATELLKLSPENAFELRLLTKREINDAANTDDAADWLLTFNVQPDAALLTLKFDNSCAVWLVDAMLGNESLSDLEKNRELTASEGAVLEFVFLNLLYAVNQHLQSPIFKFQALRPPVSFVADHLSELPPSDSMLALTWQILHESPLGVAELRVPKRAAEMLQTRENTLLDAPPRRRAEWRRLAQKIGVVRARLQIGQAQLDVGAVSGIEPGDVILLENSSFTFASHNFFGNAEIYLGDGSKARLTGYLTTPENTAAPDETEIMLQREDDKSLVRSLRAQSPFQVTIIELGQTQNPQSYAENMTENEENSPENANGENFNELLEPLGANDAAQGLALENIALTLRVELEARALSLTEIESLRLNQILELGVRPTDPVNLLINNQVVGRGELVEIDNRLGVQIISLTL